MSRYLTNETINEFDTLFDRMAPVWIGSNFLKNRFNDALGSNMSYDGYPPYNIIETEENKYSIEIAVAGFTRDDIRIEIKEDKLCVEGGINKKEEIVDENRRIIHKGIATRNFKRTFTLGEYIEVKSAEINNGILQVNLERIIPEHKKPRLIEVK